MQWESGLSCSRESRTSLTEIPRSGWAPHDGVAQGALGRRKEPEAVHRAQIPHHMSKSHICFCVNNYSHLHFCLRCEPAFQCTFGPIPRSVDPTSVSVSWCDSLRTRDTSNVLYLCTQHQQEPQCHLTGWSLRRTHVDVGHDGAQDQLGKSKIPVSFKYFAPTSRGCIKALRHSQRASVWSSKCSSVALNIISPCKPFGLFPLFLSGHFLSTYFLNECIKLMQSNA